MPISARLADEIEAFRRWAETLPRESRSAEWESEYEGWPALLDATVGFLDAGDPAGWDQAAVDALLYVLARDNECEVFKEELEKRPDHLLKLATPGLRSVEPDARWQLADALGGIAGRAAVVTALLAAYLADPDAYVRRRAMLAMEKRDADPNAQG